MKPILIDDLIKEDQVQSSASVNIDGTDYDGYQIAKPLNYDPDYFPMDERQEMANAILEGRAIAVCYFEDLSEEDKITHVRKHIK